MVQLYLPVFVSEQKSFCALQDAEPPALKTRGVLAISDSFAACFDSNHSYLSILQEGMKQSDRVTAATDAGNEQIGQPLLALKDLAACLDPDDALKIAHHHGVGMRP